MIQCLLVPEKFWEIPVGQGTFLPVLPSALWYQNSPYSSVYHASVLSKAALSWCEC